MNDLLALSALLKVIHGCTMVPANLLHFMRLGIDNLVDSYDVFLKFILHEA